MSNYRTTILTSLTLGLNLALAQAAVCLPPPQDIPEEVLRTEIITEARSPIDGKPLTAAEYAQLQAQLTEGTNPPFVNSEFQQLIFLLRLRQMLLKLSPF
jgi:hypothetical protein